MVSHAVEHGNNPIVTYFDTRKAFDTLWIEGLFYQLYHKGITGKLWRVLRMTYQGCVSSVLVCGGLTPWYDLVLGVKQGALYSMLFYVCFINDLLLDLNNLSLGIDMMGIKCCAIGYADDIAVFAMHQPIMQRLIHKASAYSRRWRFSFSPSKCAYLIYSETPQARTKRMDSGNRGLYIDDEVLEEKSEYTHVGIVNRASNVTPVNWISIGYADHVAVFAQFSGSD